MGFRGGGYWRLMRNVEEHRPDVTWALLRRVLGYAWPWRWRLLLMLLTILLTAGLGLLTPLIFRDLIDEALPSRDMQQLHLLSLLLIAVPLAIGALRLWQRKLSAEVAEELIFELRVKLFEHLQRMSLRFFTHTQTGELMSRLNNDVIGAQTAISNTIVDLLSNFVTAVATLAVMLTLEWRLTLLGVAVLPLFALLARRIARRLREIARRQMNQNASMNATINETLNISGALLVKLFGRIDSEIDRFSERAGALRETGVDQAVTSGQFFILIGLVSAIGTALVYWVGGLLVIEEVFTIGTIVAFSVYLTQLYGPLQMLTNAPVAFAQSMVSFERVFEVLDLPLEIAERENPIEIHRPRGELTFENVSFGYRESGSSLLRDVMRHGRMEDFAVFSGVSQREERLKRSRNNAGSGNSQARERALEDISFTMEPGQLVALVGPSGAGKSTMTWLIPRLYDPDQGRILVDGKDLRDVTLKSLVRQIGMVTQETYLFHDSIRSNLRYARLDASEEDMEAACRAANIHNFIVDLEKGYDTLVGERGYRLSGGEKQRIAIARVILKDPRILVLDEATSHLDSQSEALIQEALKTVMRGRTSLVIAHRLSTILAADLILVLDRGRVVERGTHGSLLAAGGLYRQLYETQFRPEAETLPGRSV
ncbi:MAG: ABC transporter ATP-binding protein [Anaerolineaceae bacterium]|nr:ABC transporter ATP-binding protein [Anaerolineaceae bacterium]